MCLKYNENMKKMLKDGKGVNDTFTKKQKKYQK